MRIPREKLHISHKKVAILIMSPLQRKVTNSNAPLLLRMPSVELLFLPIISGASSCNQTIVWLKMFQSPSLPVSKLPHTIVYNAGWRSPQQKSENHAEVPRFLQGGPGPGRGSPCKTPGTVHWMLLLRRIQTCVEYGKWKLK